MEIELPNEDTLYHVAGLFGADNEETRKWVTVGAPRRSKTQVADELQKWKNDFPDREWTVVKGHLTWEVVEDV